MTLAAHQPIWKTITVWYMEDAGWTDAPVVRGYRFDVVLVPHSSRNDNAGYDVEWIEAIDGLPPMAKTSKFLHVPVKRTKAGLLCLLREKLEMEMGAPVSGVRPHVLQEVEE